MLTVSVIGFDSCADIVKCTFNIINLIKKIAVRNKTVFNAVHNVSQCGNISTETSVEFLASKQQPAAMNINHDRKHIVISSGRAVYVKPVSTDAIINIRNIGFDCNSVRQGEITVTLDA